MLSGSALGLAIGVDEYPAIRKAADSGPGAMFTAPPLSLPAGQFGLGHGSGAHAPDEYFVVESSNPNVAGIVDAAMGYVDLFYQVARLG